MFVSLYNTTTEDAVVQLYLIIFVALVRRKPKDVVKDLGVTMNRHLQFTGRKNCKLIVGKAHSLAYRIRKCFILRNPLFLMRAFNRYVRPMLEYASPVWLPQYYLVDKIESV